MFTQIPDGHENDPVGGTQVTDYMTMLNLFNTVIGEAPEWHHDPNNPQANILVGVPINALLDWPMGTQAGYTTSYPSTSVLTDADNGWFGPSARTVMPDFVTTFVCDLDDPTGHMGFKSWDQFFTRVFQDGQREILPHLLDNDDVVFSACESAVYRISHNVQFRDQFWLKGQPYSLTHMLNNDPLAAHFTGGTIFQAYLSSTKYHRWHSPVDGYVVKTVQVPGTYFAESPTESFEDTENNGHGTDPAGPNLSQAFITPMATRALIFLRAKNPQIGLMCFIGVGMVEVSTCEMTVREGVYVTKGQEIGMFHFGGSTHCLVFRKDTDIQIDRAYIPTEDDPHPSVLLKAPIAWAGEKPYN
ncbi:hypothetical protein ONZ45_g16523 [Pleurotus djamor]|nr:hypothetical protein ONZ45_g16523 [Pleurotus djamor]